MYKPACPSCQFEKAPAVCGDQKLGCPHPMFSLPQSSLVWSCRSYDGQQAEALAQLPAGLGLLSLVEDGWSLASSQAAWWAGASWLLAWPGEWILVWRCTPGPGPFPWPARDLLASSHHRASSQRAGVRSSMWRFAMDQSQAVAVIVFGLNLFPLGGLVWFGCWF